MSHSQIKAMKLQADIRAVAKKLDRLRRETSKASGKDYFPMVRSELFDLHYGLNLAHFAIENTLNRMDRRKKSLTRKRTGLSSHGSGRSGNRP